MLINIIAIEKLFVSFLFSNSCMWRASVEGRGNGQFAVYSWYAAKNWDIFYVNAAKLSK